MLAVAAVATGSSPAMAPRPLAGIETGNAMPMTRLPTISCPGTIGRAGSGSSPSMRCRPVGHIAAGFHPEQDLPGAQRVAGMAARNFSGFPPGRIARIVS